MLKNSLDATGHAALDPAIQALYKKTGDTFILQHDEPVGELKRAKDRETAEVTRLNAELGTTKVALTAAETKLAAVPSVDAIKATAKAEAAAEFEPTKLLLTKREAFIQSSLVETEASKLALKIGGTKNADALLPHITKHLVADITGDAPKVTVMKDGKASTTTLVDLEKELRADTKLSSLVIASQATGGAGRQGSTVPLQSPAGGAGKPTLLRDMSQADRIAHVASKQAAEQTQ
jgi:hypothetical protein